MADSRCRHCRSNQGTDQVSPFGENKEGTEARGVVELCPSGALTHRDKEGGPEKALAENCVAVVYNSPSSPTASWISTERQMICHAFVSARPYAVASSPQTSPCATAATRTLASGEAESQSS